MWGKWAGGFAACVVERRGGKVAQAVPAVADVPHDEQPVLFFFFSLCLPQASSWGDWLSKPVPCLLRLGLSGCRRLFRVPACKKLLTSSSPTAGGAVSGRWQCRGRTRESKARASGRHSLFIDCPLIQLGKMR